MTPATDSIITIRIAGPEDAPAVAALLSELGYPSEPRQVAMRLESYSGSAGSAVFVACMGDGVAGVLSFHCIPLLHTDDLLGRITSLVVSAASRRLGIGALLVAEAESFGRQRGCSRFEVTSGDHREDAHAFYERLDYHPDCRRFLKAAAQPG